MQTTAEIRLLHGRLRRFSRYTGKPDADFIWKLGECAEARAPTRLLRLLFQAARVGSPDAGLKELAGHVLAAYETVLDALWRYRAGHEKLQFRVLGQLNKLKRARVKDRGNFLHQMIADPEHEPALLSALWRAAESFGDLREQGHRQCRTIEVLVDGAWIAQTVSNPWYVLLTDDEALFGKILDRARMSAATAYSYVRRTRGRPAHRALDAFADAVNASVFELRGAPLTYARGTETARPALRGKSYGLGLSIMLAALQLIDSSLGASQAQAQIDRIRDW